MTIQSACRDTEKSDMQYSENRNQNTYDRVLCCCKPTIVQRATATADQQQYSTSAMTQLMISQHKIMLVEHETSRNNR
jgi:hypothetical protein